MNEKLPFFCSAVIYFLWNLHLRAETRAVCLCCRRSCCTCGWRETAPPSATAVTGASNATRGWRACTASGVRSQWVQRREGTMKSRGGLETKTNISQVVSDVTTYFTLVDNLLYFLLVRIICWNFHPMCWWGISSQLQQVSLQTLDRHDCCGSEPRVLFLTQSSKVLSLCVLAAQQVCVPCEARVWRRRPAGPHSAALLHLPRRAGENCSQCPSAGDPPMWRLHPFDPPLLLNPNSSIFSDQ